METDKKVIEYEAAIKELEIIQDIFDVVYDAGDKEKILPAIMAGRFLPDGATETVVYELQKPIEQKNSGIRTEIKFRTPSVSDIEYINKGFSIKVNSNNETIMDMGQMQERTSRAVVKLSGWPTGIVDRISRKDMRVLSGLFNFFD